MTRNRDKRKGGVGLARKAGNRCGVAGGARRGGRGWRIETGRGRLLGRTALHSKYTRSFRMENGGGSPCTFGSGTLPPPVSWFGSLLMKGCGMAGANLGEPSPTGGTDHLLAAGHYQVTGKVSPPTRHLSLHHILWLGATPTYICTQRFDSA